MDNEVEKALDTLELFQFYLAAICASKGEMSKFERDLISAVDIVVGRLK